MDSGVILDMANRRVLASEILEDLEREIRQLQMQIESSNQKLRDLETQRDAARILTGAEGTTPQSVAGTVQLLRAKNLSGIAYQFLRDHRPNGETVVELYRLLLNTGAAVGSRTYLYKICADLERDGLIQKGQDGRYRVKKSPTAPES